MLQTTKIFMWILDRRLQQDVITRLDIIGHRRFELMHGICNSLPDINDVGV